MSESFFLLVNQDQQLLARSGEWLGTRQEKLLYRSQYRDEAINLKVDHAVKQPDMRLRIIEVTMSEGKMDFTAHADLVDYVAPPVVESNDDESIGTEEDLDAEQNKVEPPSEPPQTPSLSTNEA